jgi:hypothetical protein
VYLVFFGFQKLRYENYGPYWDTTPYKEKKNERNSFQVLFLLAHTQRHKMKENEGKYLIMFFLIVFLSKEKDVDHNGERN